MLLAHLSDLHVFDLTGTGPLPFLTKRLAGLVNLGLHRRDKHQLALFEALIADLNVVRPDEIVITGDVTNLSLESELKRAREILDRLEAGTRHVTIVPGNHDVYTLDAFVRRPFLAHLLPYASSDSGDQDFPVVRVRDPIAIVGLSTARPSPVPFASGSLGARQLRRLEERLFELGRRGLFRVVLLHHPPFDNRAAVLRGLRDRGALQAVLARVGAELVLHGHEHRDLSTSLRGPDGPIPVSCVGSATYDHARLDRRARYHLYEIVAGQSGGRPHIVRREVRVHDPEQGSVVAYAGTA
jgi:3',5'-cyclic AMP phosphodiesterase CpdA